MMCDSESVDLAYQLSDGTYDTIVVQKYMYDGLPVYVYHMGMPSANDVNRINVADKYARDNGGKFRVVQDPYVCNTCDDWVIYENSYGRFVRPTEKMIFMNMAIMIAQRSTCIRRKVGAVITDNKMHRVLCFGYNGNVVGGPNQCDSLDEGQCGCVHAEINALTKSDTTLDGATCFVTLSPCVNCAKVLINRGIKRVIYHEC
jgi:dCMP deaminase